MQTSQTSTVIHQVQKAPSENRFVLISIWKHSCEIIQIELPYTSGGRM